MIKSFNLRGVYEQENNFKALYINDNTNVMSQGKYEDSQTH